MGSSSDRCDITTFTTNTNTNIKHHLTYMRVRRYLAWSSLIYLFPLLVTLFTSSTSSGLAFGVGNVGGGGGTARCFNICQRSEFEMKCRRCRWREPLRFGKRTNPALERDTYLNLNPTASSDYQHQPHHNHRVSSPSSSSSMLPIKSVEPSWLVSLGRSPLSQSAAAAPSSGPFSTGYDEDNNLNHNKNIISTNYYHHHQPPAPSSLSTSVSPERKGQMMDEMDNKSKSILIHYLLAKVFPNNQPLDTLIDPWNDKSRTIIPITDNSVDLDDNKNDNNNNINGRHFQSVHDD